MHIGLLFDDLCPICPCQILDIPKSDYRVVCSDAGKIWSEVYGRVRASGTENRPARRDRGCPRKPELSSGQKPSLARWVKNRKLDVHERTQAACGDPAAPAGRLQDLQTARWTLGHEKELAHLKDFKL